jgi:shikimate dehydrogenase
VIPVPTASTRLVALLGDPVAHSLSPAFQNAAFRAAGVDGVYVALRCDGGSCAALLPAIARAGGAGNVTLPHKALAAETVDRRTAAVERTGACNTFWYDDGAVWGDNTDVAGFSRALRELLGVAPAGARVLVLGAGGAARAALCSLVEDGAGEVVLLNRTVHRSRLLADHFAAARIPVRAAPAAEALVGERFDVVINATSLGLRNGDPHPLDPSLGVHFGAALDLVYRPESTPWVRALMQRGVAAADGLTMLLYQGAAAFERWWGIPAPLEAMRTALPPRAIDGRDKVASQPL